MKVGDVYKLPIKSKKMISLKTSASVWQEVNLNIETPSFYHVELSGYFLAIISEENIYRVFNGITYNSIQNGTIEAMKSDIVESVNNGKQIEEKEFLSAYNEARKMTDLSPRLALHNTESIFTLTPEEQEERDRQYEEDRVNDYFERELDRD